MGRASETFAPEVFGKAPLLYFDSVSDKAVEVSGRECKRLT